MTNEMVHRVIQKILRKQKMKFEDINFHESGRRDRPGLGLYLPGECWVGKTTFEMAWNQVRKGLPEPDDRKQYTARMMCGEEFWQSHPCRRRPSLGRSIKYFVTHEMLPLREVNAGKKGSRKYVRILQIAASAKAGVAILQSVAIRTQTTSERAG